MDEIGARFEIPGRMIESAPYGGGHIHDTFLARFEHSGVVARFILQRINGAVFRDPVALMDNVVRICAHQQRALERRGVADADRRCLTVIPGRDGRPYAIDADGGYWRCFRYLEGTRSLETVQTEDQAYQAARAFGEFAQVLSDLGDPPLATTLPHFHDLSHRYAALETAIRSDPCGRSNGLAAEIERARQAHRALTAEHRAAGTDAAPRRPVHNDCKIDNVLLDAHSGEGLCVIDLDTVMEGSVLYDFGELVRTASCRSPEDEVQLGSMVLDLDLMRALARGYRAGAALTAAELAILPLAGPTMAFENGVRFLTDHLMGDRYFRVHRPGHNLDRFRAQLRLVELMAEQQEAIGRILDPASR